MGDTFIFLLGWIIGLVTGLVEKVNSKIKENEKRKDIIKANYHEYSELSKERNKIYEENGFLKDDVQIRDERIEELEKELHELKRAASKS
ncbi:hypothetical protein Q8G37_15835 [Bacillus wiedmannii]|uniref:hypothetical protein n=1 Tax=Bacillus wiedmannii TaxID=1890302 RepID=UPI0027304158|nr:hypothetical protein [Bacillus wiedmannii]MDP1457917.1 hypothetical protein [Bacillus wiedmannii]